MRSTKPVISFVILTTGNRMPQLVNAVRSIRIQSKQARIPVEVIIVVNTKTELSPGRYFRDTAVLLMGGNRGVAGYNAGFRKARAPWVFAFDDDCELPPGMLKKALRIIASAPPAAAVISANVYNPAASGYEYRKFLDRSLTDIPTFAGGASLMRRSVILDLGGYDEDFFLWLHEEDLALRIRASGYSVLFDPELVIFHHDPPDKPFRRNYFRYVFRNKARLNLKYFALPLLAVMVPRDLIWILIEAWRFRSSAVITNGLKGYLTGYIEDRPARKKSGLLPGKLQMEYVFTFWTGFYFQAA